MPITLSSYEFTNTELFHKPVRHDDIKKFGIDMTQKAKPANSGSSSNSIEKISANECLGFLSIYKAFDTIQINKHNCGKIDTVVADRNTGYILQPNDAFNHISKFDKNTFPNNQTAYLNEVNYWNQSNNYIENSNIN